MTKKRRRAEKAPGRRLPVEVAPREGGGVALEVGGVVQSVSVAPDGGEPQGYWRLMPPPNGSPPVRRALLLGLGAGTVAHLLARRWPAVEIVGVEANPDVVVEGMRSFGLERLAQLRIAQADAFAWVAEAVEREPEGFDYIALDLFLAGRLVPGALATPFLRQLAGLLTLDGLLAVNLMLTARTPEQLHRLQRVFLVRREQRLRGNLVVHLTRPAHAEQGASVDGSGMAAAISGARPAPRHT